MTESTTRKLSRRDAMKILGAAIGATALATLPPEWSKPKLATGVLPAYARQSVGTRIVRSVLRDDFDHSLPPNICQPFCSIATINPAAGNIPLHYVVTSDIAPILSPVAVGNPPSPASFSGQMNTKANGEAVLSKIQIDVSKLLAKTVTVTVEWSFVNPDDGSGSSLEGITTVVTC